MTTAVDRRRRCWSWGRVTLVVLLLILIVPASFVEIAPDAPRPVALPPAPPGTYLVYVADWGYHTSIILQQAPGWQLGSLGSESAPFVEFAWGDRSFYLDSNHRPDAVFATLFLPTESVAYVESWRGDPARIARPRALYARALDASQLTALAADLEGSLRRTDTAVRPAAFPQTPHDAGRFYPAHGKYLWWNDCNRWTTDRLADAHLARGGRGVIFSRQVASQLIGFARIGP
jgi:hypothetical protein